MHLLQFHACAVVGEDGLGKLKIKTVVKGFGDRIDGISRFCIAIVIGEPVYQGDVTISGKDALVDCQVSTGGGGFIKVPFTCLLVKPVGLLVFEWIQGNGEL